MAFGVLRSLTRWAAVLAVAASAAWAQPHSTDSETITLDEARVVAWQAIHAGRFDLARHLALGLLQADPEDHFAYAVLAAAHSRLGDAKLARTAARLSYRYADTPEQKFAAARTAASVAVQQDRATQGQAWLRLAAVHADSDRQESLLRRDYARARAANPLRLSFSLSVAPSDNVNSGTDNTLLVINGIPTSAIFGDSTRALSGVVTTADLRLRYRLDRSERSTTHATGRLYRRDVSLRDEVAGLDGGDFATSVAEGGLAHRFALGAKGNSASLEGVIGSLWSGDDKSFDYAKVTLGRSIQLSQTSRLRLSAAAEDRQSAIDPLRDASVLTLSGSVTHKRPNGGRLSFGLTLQDVQSDAQNAEYQSATARLSYVFGEALGPAQVSMGLTLGATDYKSFTLIGPVAGGREDLSVYADVSFMFDDYGFAGFAPTLTLRTGQRNSNINRFEIRETTLTLGLQSKF